MIELFSIEFQEGIGFASATQHYWIKQNKTKTNDDSLALVFPRFASPTCNRPFPSHLVLMFQNDSSFKTFHMQMISHLHDD